MQGLHSNSDDSQMRHSAPETDDLPDDTEQFPVFDPTTFEPVALIVNNGSNELDDEVDRAIGVVIGLRTALLHPGDAIRRAALAAADDWLQQFQSPLG
jgi:hypothetical protein